MKWMLPRSNWMFWWISNMTWGVNNRFRNQCWSHNSCWERCRRLWRSCWLRGRRILSVKDLLWWDICRKRRRYTRTLWIRLSLWLRKLVPHLTSLRPVWPLLLRQSKIWVLINVPKGHSSWMFWKESTMKFKIPKRSWTMFVPIRSPRARRRKTQHGK